MDPNNQQGRPTTKQSDTMVQAKMHDLPPGQIGIFTKQQGVTADQVAGMGLSFQTSQFRLGILAGGGLNHETEQHVHIPSPSPDSLVVLVRAKSLLFTEYTTPKSLTFPGLDKVKQALAQVPDKTGKPAIDIYVPTDTRERLIQCVDLPNTDNSMTLCQKGKPGISSVRYVAEDGWQKLFCVFTDAQGRGTAVAAYGIDEAEANPTTLGQQSRWTKIVDHPGRAIMSFGRPVMKGDHVNLIVNLQDGYQCKLTLAKQANGRIAGAWGQEHKADHFAIGIVSGQTDIFASYAPDQNGARMTFEKWPTANTAAAAYLQQ